MGELTSVARSPLTGKVLALARVKSPYFEGKLPLERRPAGLPRLSRRARPKWSSFEVR